MTDDAAIDRRAFVTGCVGAMGVLLTPTPRAVAAAIQPPVLTTLSVIVDPRIDVAARFGAALAHRGATLHAVHGDTYRFIRRLMSAGDAPMTIAGVGSYADFIVTTGALREARYAIVSHGLHAPSGRVRHRCFGDWEGCEVALQRSADSWPATLADVVAGRLTLGLNLGQSVAVSKNADTGTRLSWVMRSTNSRT